ncbi:MAG: T9SS type A sorting domain-containing protein [Bacteroidales bacterium]
MKKLFTIALLVTLSLPILAQNDIPNWSFEHWDSAYYLSPNHWDMTMGKITPVSPSHGGLWACKIESDSAQQGPGVVMDGQTNDGITFWGGKPYSQRPDSVELYMKYDIAPYDTARLAIMFKKNGTPIVYQFEALAWGLHTASYQKFTCKIDLPPTIVPDTVIFGIVNSDYISHPNGPWPTSNYLIIDDITFTGAGITQQLPNNGFEQWNSTEVFNLQNWYTSNNVMAQLLGLPEPMVRTSDHTTGNYGLLLQNYVSSTDTVYGATCTPSSGPDPWNNTPAFELTQPFTYNTFWFDYKYLPLNGDTMSINVGLFKNGAGIGGTYFESGATVTNWTTVYLPLYYNPGFPPDPDSAKIYICAYKSDSASVPQGNSKLYIDNLRFGYAADVKSQTELNTGFSVYPNPFSSITTINYQIKNNEKVVIKVVDVLGKEVAALVNETMPKGNYRVTFDGSDLTKGIYFCRIKAGSYTETKKLVLVK